MVWLVMASDSRDADELICELYRLGMVDYEQAWQLQDRLAAEIAAGERAPTLLLLEHPHTYTFGRRGKAENLLWDETELTRQGVQVYWVDRGGDVTYHGPGQLVGYPLLPLAPGGLLRQVDEQNPRLPQADYLGYLRKIENVLIQALSSLGVSSYTIEGLTGVWTEIPARGPAKIAAIGIKVDVHGISRHGFALNVKTDMNYWQGIIGCGLKDRVVCNLADLLAPVPSMEIVSRAVERAFTDVFGFSLYPKTGEPVRKL